MHAATVHAADWWARPRGAESAHWIANYQKSVQSRHRSVISAIVGELGAATVLEVGCHCGPNLVRLAQDHPTLRGYGFDANAEAIAAGQQWAARAGLRDRVEMVTGRFPTATEKFPTGSFDVVLSCYSLAYIAPADLDAALYEMGRVAKQAVILAEPHVDTGPATTRQSFGGYAEWQHPYQMTIPWIATLRNRSVRVVPVDPPVDALRAVLVLTQ